MYGQRWLLGSFLPVVSSSGTVLPALLRISPFHWALSFTLLANKGNDPSSGCPYAANITGFVSANGTRMAQTDAREGPHQPTSPAVKPQSAGVSGSRHLLSYWRDQLCHVRLVYIIIQINHEGGRCIEGEKKNHPKSQQWSEGMCSNKLRCKLNLGLLLSKQSDCKERDGLAAKYLQSGCITWETVKSFVLYTQMFVLLFLPLCFPVLVLLLWPWQFISSHLRLQAGPGRTGRFVRVWHTECVNWDTAKGCYCRFKKRTETPVSKAVVTSAQALVPRTCLVMKKPIFDKVW